MSWKAEIRQQMASMNSRGSHIPHMEEDLVKRRHDELKHAQVTKSFIYLFICSFIYVFIYFSLAILKIYVLCK